MRTAAPDPYSSVQPGHERMDIASAHRWSRGRGVRIALIDTGLDSAHPDLRGRIDLERNFVDEDARRFQLDRHGTAIAGVIAANADNGVGIVGIAPEARLLALKACWQLQEGAMRRAATPTRWHRRWRPPSSSRRGSSTLASPDRPMPCWPRS